jgi:peptidoglycan/xylan/chitin deacetylase (PgdA/CDA1 family)
MRYVMVSVSLAAAIGVLYLVVPWFAKNLLRRRLMTRARQRGCVCLTFDDGPDPRSTPRILQLLDAAGAKGTFFLLGRQAQQHPELVRQIAASGHEVGEHGHAHRHAWKTGPVSYLRDLLQGRRSLAYALGADTVRVFRPAFGELNLLTLVYLLVGRRRLVMWDVNPRDFEQQTGSEVAALVLRSLEPGGIVLLHDGRADAPGSADVTVDAVRLILVEAARRGLRLTTASEAAGPR